MTLDRYLLFADTIDASNIKQKRPICVLIDIISTRRSRDTKSYTKTIRIEAKNTQSEIKSAALMFDACNGSCFKQTDLLTLSEFR